MSGLRPILPAGGLATIAGLMRRRGAGGGAGDRPHLVAVLQGLDKITARISTGAARCSMVPTVAFGTLRDHRPRLPRDAADRAAGERGVPRDPRAAAGLGSGRPRTELFIGLDVRLEPGGLGARAPGLRRLGGRLRGADRAAAGRPPGRPRRHRQHAAGSRRRTSPASRAQRAGRRADRPGAMISTAPKRCRWSVTNWVSSSTIAAGAQALDQVDQGDLAGIAPAREHALAEERRAERDAVETAGERAVAPDLDAVGEAALVQLDSRARSARRSARCAAAPASAAAQASDDLPRRRGRPGSRSAPRRITLRRLRGTWKRLERQDAAPPAARSSGWSDRGDRSAIGNTPAGVGAQQQLGRQACMCPGYRSPDLAARPASISRASPVGQEPAEPAGVDSRRSRTSSVRRRSPAAAGRWSGCRRSRTRRGSARSRRRQAARSMSCTISLAIRLS